MQKTTSSGAVVRDALYWVVFGCFCFGLLAAVILFVTLLIARKGFKWVLILLVVGWSLRCASIVKDVSGSVLSNFAGLLFFATCCVVVLQVLRNFHEQRDSPGSIYRSLKFTLVGYNAFFFVLEACTTVGAIVARNTMADWTDAQHLIDKILGVLFGMSYAFLVVIYIVVAYLLRSSFHYLRFIIPFYAVTVLALTFRSATNIASVISGLTDWIDVSLDGTLGDIFREALPGVMMLIIVALNRSPWEGPYMPLSQIQKDPARGDALTVNDVFRDPQINLIPREALVQLDVVGSGVSATVYKSNYKGNIVALKVFHLTVGEMTKSQTAYIAREVKLMSSLMHPNIVQLYGVTWTPEGQLGIVSELVDLGSLKAVLPLMHRDMHWSLRLRMALDVVRGMSFIHSRGVLHRDLKSANVLVTKVLLCKVSDMGLACFSGFEATNQPVVGTLEYMAPEVLLRRTYTTKADVYSFGVVLYELASGRPPFSECSLAPAEMRAAIETGRLTIRVSPACPKPVADLITRCTSQDADTRPSFAELEQKIDTLRNSAGSLQDPYQQ